jgi:site-specific DNA-cytosine methylase
MPIEDLIGICNMRVLIACEFSGIVREAFRALGHDAWSCDLLETEIPGKHIQGDILEWLDDGWDLMIAHPPCTHLAVSGARWFKDKQQEQQEAVEFFMSLVNAPIDKICVENPVSIMSTRYRKPDQIIQPWQFGHPEPKRTCLWLKNLPLLVPTNIVEPEEYTVFSSGRRMPTWYQKLWGLPKEERQKVRSRTFIGIAQAMAEQFSK